MTFKNIIAFLFVIVFCTLYAPVNAGKHFADSTKQSIAITLTLTPINSTCQKPNGKLIANVSGGVLPYSYTITYPNNITYPWNSNIIPSLPAGIYTVTVTDAIGATANQITTVGNTFTRPITSLIGFTTATTQTSQDATLSFSAANGTPPYMYSLDNVNFQASNMFTNLAGGEYYRIAKDANGCSSFRDWGNDGVLIPNNFLITANSIGGGSGMQCNPFLFRLDVPQNGVGGGTPPYTFSVDGVNYQTGSFYNLPAGVYIIWVKDAVGDILLEARTLVDNCTSTFSINTTTQTALCGINGSITATAALGEAPYQYAIDGVNFGNNNVFTGLAPGGYTITVKDAYGFINSKYVVVPNNCLQVLPNTTSSTCGNNNGTITAQASNGMPPYEYSLNGGAYSSTNVFTGLAANSYTVRAKDATNRIATANTVVSNIAGAQVTAADTTATGCSNNTGTINVEAQGGTAPYLYSINGSSFVNTPLFTGLAQNNYTVTVKDARGCLTTKPALITLTNNLTIDAGDTVKICEGTSGLTNATGNATTYAWLPTDGLATPSVLNTSINPTQTTTYYLTGTTVVCTKTDSMLVLVKPVPIPNAGQGTTICFGKNASLQAGAGQATYTWQPTTYLSNINGANADVLQPTKNITYSLAVIGANGCASLQDGQVTIKVTPPPKVFVGRDTSIAIGEPFVLQALDVNGSGFNQFAWQPFYLLNDATAQYPLIQNIKDNTIFSVIATTQAGCVGKDSIHIKVFTKPDIYVPNAFTPNGDGTNDVLLAIPVGIKAFAFFSVYDRYGQTVFTTTNAYNGWDGKNKNGILNTGSFVWVASGVDFNGRRVEKRGAVLLVR